MLNTRHLLVLGVAGVLGLSAASQSMAAPVIGSGAAIKAAAADDTINVQWRRWGWRGGWRGGWGPGLGVGLGLGIASAAIAAPYYGGYGYGGYGYCGPYGSCGGYGGYGYAYAPAVAVIPAPVVAVPAYGYAASYYGGGWRGGYGW